VIEGDDWYGPVTWSNSDGDVHTLAGTELSTAVAPLRDGFENPDAQFVADVLAGNAATPDFADAVEVQVAVAGA
jgi:hypothetical protein